MSSWRKILMYFLIVCWLSSLIHFKFENCAREDIIQQPEVLLKCGFLIFEIAGQCTIVVVGLVEGCDWSLATWMEYEWQTKRWFSPPLSRPFHQLTHSIHGQRQKNCNNWSILLTRVRTFYKRLHLWYFFPHVLKRYLNFITFKALWYIFSWSVDLYFISLVFLDSSKGAAK